MRLILGLIFAVAGFSQVHAKDWLALDGSEITTALSGKNLKYEGATQKFFPSGRTLYNAGEDSWGYWRVEGNLYCSQWPPGQSWDCYRMEKSENGSQIRFLDVEGRPFVGKFE
ncbi:MAG: hypothetical protein ACI861_000845 [Paracoccaceae bacterium]|jgi:hypothetical protein